MKKTNFNQGWKVWKETDAFELVFRVPKDAREVTLPCDAALWETQDPQSKSAGKTGFIDGSVYKFYKEFFVPEDAREDRFLLELESVYMNAFVYVNQSLAGSCAYGYTDFYVDMEPYLRYGEMNQVLVLVKCGAVPNSRWYSGGGIYRPVTLHTAGAVCLPPRGLRLTTLELQPGSAQVEISADVENRGPATKVQVTAELSTEKGEPVLSRSYPVRVRRGEKLTLRKSVHVENPQLWSAETPSLYRLKVRVEKDGAVLDEDEIVTGIRKLSLDAKNGLRVNGKPVKLRGGCIHHDQGLLGAACFEDYEMRRVRIMKEAGFNAIRSAHNPASQALLNACDRLGMYVMNELTDVWTKNKTDYDYSMTFEQDWKKDIEAMVDSSRHHPSVILYSTGNEIFEIATDRGVEVSRMLGESLHQLDNTRYTTNGINGAFAAGDRLAEIVCDITGADPNSGDVNVFMAAMGTHMDEIVAHPILSGILEQLEPTMDILGYNYMTSRYERDASAYPDRIMIGTETFPRQIAENWAVITRCPAVLGDFTWTGWDYMGEVPQPFPALLNDSGDISTIGVRRPVSKYREIVFGLTKGPSLAVLAPQYAHSPRWFGGPWRFTEARFCWRYDGEEGKEVVAEVYAGGDEVELLVNGRSIGRKPCGKETEYYALFPLPYEPGELTAVAYEKGQEIGRCSLETTGDPKTVQVEMESQKAGCGEDRLLFAEISLLDEQGRVTTSQDRKIHIAVEGPAKLAAFGSMNTVHHQGFELPDTSTEQGRALAILRCTGETGPVHVVVTGEGLTTGEAVCQVQKDSL